MTSHRVPGRYPAPGASPVADRIRERRGARGLSPLDGTLLHAPAIADGWNSLLGAVRTKGKLPGDLRELMILRVAAHNHAAFEWIQHEIVGRKEGLTTTQLVVIRNTSAPAPDPEAPGVLSGLQAAALAFAEQSTKAIKVSDQVVDALTSRLYGLTSEGSQSKEDQVQDLLVEAAAVVATYNMVSRFLVSLDVAGLAESPVPWPADRQDHTVPLSSSPAASPQFLHAVTYITSPEAPYLLFSNSLLTSTTMWDLVLPSILGPTRAYNVILYDQRGHGASSVPSPPNSTMEDLADDIATILDHLHIPRLHAAIGVSQGGATVLAFAARHQTRTAAVVACDTQAVTPPANRAAWEERIALAAGGVNEAAGMAALADATAARWFPAGSPFHTGGARAGFITNMVAATPRDGFVAGARSLQAYDLVKGGLLESAVPALLVAGEHDAGGKIAEGMRDLQGTWSAKGGRVRYLEIAGSGHLPMVDNADAFWKGVSSFLEAIGK